MKPNNFCSRGCSGRYHAAHPTPAILERAEKRKTGRMVPCESCGTETYFSAGRIRRLERGDTQKPFCSPSCQARYHSSRRVGPLGGNWKGGVARYPRAFLAARKIALERDGNSCQMDGPHSGRIEVHHIDEDKQNTHLDNLTSLCAKCHKRAHRWCRV